MVLEHVPDVKFFQHQDVVLPVEISQQLFLVFVTLTLNMKMEPCEQETYVVPSPSNLSSCERVFSAVS